MEEVYSPHDHHHFHPDEIMDSVYTVVTDMGRLSFVMKAPKIEKYSYVDPKTVFPDGVEVEFYDSLHVKESVLTANKAVMNDVNDRIELTGNVIFRNLQKEQTLYTEALTWQKGQDSSFFHTNEKVKVVDKTNIYEGKNGIIAAENFSWYVIKKFSADFVVPDSTAKEN